MQHSKILEVHMNQDMTGLDRTLVRVPAAGYGLMVVRYFMNRYGSYGGYHMWNEISEEKALEIKDRGWKVEEMDLTKTPEAEVFAIHGVEPEVLAYAMAKYSRSALSMKESLKDISSQAAEKFLNTFYFQYGHRSIADLAHVPIALENISLLAAIEVVDEQRWDGQERSTRYQDFSKRLYYTPADLDEVEAAHYHKSMNELFDAYEDICKEVEEQFAIDNPLPEGMDKDAWRRTIKARAFDVARYLLPLATLTSVGQITSARTLEGQISRLYSSRYTEVRELGDKLKSAASSPAYVPYSKEREEAFDGAWAKINDDEALVVEGLFNNVYPTRTLVKHSDRSFFQEGLAKLVDSMVDSYFVLRVDAVEKANERLVDAFIIGPDEAEIEIVSTIIYEHTNLPFSVICEVVRRAESAAFRKNFLEQALALRGKHDELPRSFRAGGGIIFDIHMDIGGMRDMHRHRRCTQIMQRYTAEGFMAPEPTFGTQFEDNYARIMAKVRSNHQIMQYLRKAKGKLNGPEDYLLPLGTRTGLLMKMDVAEIAYIAELRTGPAGHISYRRVAWQMYKALQKIAPNVAAGIADRVTDPDSPLDFFKR